MALLDNPSKTTHGLIVQGRSGAHFVTPFFDLPRSYVIAAANSIAHGIQRISDASCRFSARNATIDEKLHRGGSEGNKTFFPQRVRWPMFYFLRPQKGVDLAAIEIVESVTEPPERKQSLRVAIKDNCQKKQNTPQCNFGARTSGILTLGSIGSAGKFQIAMQVSK